MSAEESGITDTARRSDPMPTLNRLLSGVECPYEAECICHNGYWCPNAINSTKNRETYFPMLHLMKCAFRNPLCCCRVLDEIESLADEYVDEANLREPPVPIHILSLFDRGRPIEIRSLPLRSCYGAAWYLEDEWVIHINANISPAEGRFTTFHEGFHVICRNSNLRPKVKSIGCQALSERLADFFAACIMIPRHFLYDMPRSALTSRHIAMAFDVPEAVAEGRLERLVKPDLPG